MCEILKTKQEMIVMFLEDYFSIPPRVVLKHRGIVNKFMGDGIMALFEVFSNSKEIDKDAIDTEEAALEFKDEFRRLLSNWSDTWTGIADQKIDISLRAGINTGNAIVGNIGDQNRYYCHQFTAIGSVVNIANRLESRADDMQILVTSKTRQKIANKFELRKAKVITLKNIDRVFECFEVIKRITTSHTSNNNKD